MASYRAFPSGQYNVIPLAPLPFGYKPIAVKIITIRIMIIIITKREKGTK